MTAKCSRTGATRNAATARSSSRTANTRCNPAERSENAARNSAGVTEAPMPTPVSPEPARVNVDEGGMTSRSIRTPAVKKIIPARTK